MNGLGRNTKEKKPKQSIFTKETLGVVLLLFSTLSLVFLISSDKVFGKPGLWVSQFLLGAFGYFSYAFFVWLGFVGTLMFLGKKTGIKLKYKVLLTLSVISLSVFIHLLSMGDSFSGYGEYISSAYNKGVQGFSSASAGGVLISLVAYFFYKLTLSGGCVISAIVFVATVGLFVYDRFIKNRKHVAVKSDENFNGSFTQKTEDTKENSGEIQSDADYNGGGAVVDASNVKKGNRLFINGSDEFTFKSKRELSKEDEGIKLSHGQNGLSIANDTSYAKSYEDELQKKIEYVKTPAKINVDNKYTSGFNTTVSSPILFTSGNEEEKTETTAKEEVNSTIKEIPFIEHEDNTGSVNLNEMEKYAQIEEGTEFTVSSNDSGIPIMEEKTTENTASEDVARDFSAIENIKDDEDETSVAPEREDVPPISRIARDGRARDIFNLETDDKDSEKETPEFTGRLERNGRESIKRDADKLEGIGGRRLDERQNRRFGFEENDARPEVSEEKPPKEIPPINREYFRPPLDLLETYSPPENAPSEDHETRMEIIKQTLADFHINVEPQGYVQGPSITRYEVMMPAGVSVKNVLRLDDDLRMRLASQNGVRIEAPIPGKNSVGFEVANKNKVTVGLKEILQEGAKEKQKSGSLMFAIGKDIVGKAIFDDLAKGPHYLVAGATGSGKSVCLNLMIVSLIMRYSPEELRLILVDPKGNEFRPYEHIPHLMIDEIITEPKKALAVLSWARDEMERRYKMLEECGGIRDIDSYNENVASDTVPKMPRVVIIVDELSNLMETCKRDMESRILAIAQKARAIGIHLVLATQRPSVDVITGTIKANLPSRIALKVTNFADSNTILAEGGAEKLLGHGDMLYKNSGMSECERYQGAWICDREINNIVSYIKEKNKAYFDDEMKEFLDKETKPKQEENTSDAGGSAEPEGESVEFLKALWLAVNAGTVSISQLQRRFQIGWAKAGGFVDKMERLGYISGNEGSKARRVLLTREEFENKFGPMSDAF